MAGRITCTCGCGLEVTYATKRNHLNARGTTSLRARVGTETKLLKGNTRQQQKPTPLLQRGLKKRASSNPDQDGSRKRLKAAQLEENQLPEIAASSQVDEDLLPPIATDTDRQSIFIERSQGVMEMRWRTIRRDGGSCSDGRDDDEDKDKDGDVDEDEHKDKDKDEDKDKDKEDKDGDEEDEDENEPPFYDSEIPGMSDWDMLGEDFEREAAALGVYFSRMNYLPS